MHVTLSPALSTGGDRDFATYLDLGSIKGNHGEQNYAVPAGTDIGRYRSVVIWCKRFSVGFYARCMMFEAAEQYGLQPDNPVVYDPVSGGTALGVLLLSTVFLLAVGMVLATTFARTTRVTLACCRPRSRRRFPHHGDTSPLDPDSIFR